MARAVRYSRGSQSVELPATVGSSDFQVETSVGAIETFESRDYIVRAADLVLADQLITPQRGDTISETQAGVTYTYEVLAPGAEQCWRWSDPYRVSMRIHTKQVS